MKVSDLTHAMARALLEPNDCESGDWDDAYVAGLVMIQRNGVHVRTPDGECLPLEAHRVLQADTEALKDLDG